MYVGKRVVCFGLSLILLLALAACGGGGSSSTSSSSGSGSSNGSGSSGSGSGGSGNSGSGSGGSNAIPIASNGAVTTTENTAISGTLSASDTDGDTLAISIVSNPAHGTANLTNAASGAFTYTPTSGFTGSDSFTFKATDSASNVSNTATESVTVNAGSGGGGGSGNTAPGAPTLTSVTAGSGSIELVFSAPSSDGGVSITGYTATCTAAGNTDFSASGTASPITVTGMNGGVTRSCTVAAVNSVGTGTASNAMSDTPTSLAPEDLTHLPLGDTLSTTSVPTKVGYLYVCSVTSGGGASAKGPWFNSDGTTWDETKKLAVQGSNTMSSTFSYSVSGNTLNVSGNDIPSHPVGTFPIATSDPVHAYDGNPNSISSSDTISWSLPANPSVASTPSCTQGTIGFLVTGARLFNAVDAGDRDAVAWEGQDDCHGHPNSSGAYHYHNLTDQSCLPASAQDVAGQHSPVVGYAADGFPIYGNLGQDGVPLSDADLDICHGHTHAITFNGKTVVMYHYHATHAFPYVVGCYRGTPKHIQ